ncbi:MAG: hypothetical protein LRY73_05770 [Bacillus sp. (in: Bacteria)]|nr:hypothetical protein [Bacillus sp. (in: firmicutes)]
MIFEFSNDLVPILFSMSIVLTIIAAQLVDGMAKDYTVSRRHRVNNSLQAVTAVSTTETEVTEELVEKQNFLTRIVKRKEAPEDDADYFFSSKAIITDRYRGGQQWKTNLYSTSLKGMVFSF